MLLLVLLAGIAVFLTRTMFQARQPMLGFPCGIFWVLTGAQAFTLSTVPWGDIYYYVFFSSSIGMTIFTMFAAFGLREKRDTYADEEMEQGDRKYADKGSKQDTGESSKSVSVGSDTDTEKDDKDDGPSQRVLELRKRAAERRSRKPKRGEFNW